jgi:hypothetical protein
VLVGRSELMLPLIVLSVGLYLLVLAPILGLVQYYVVGALATPGNSWLIIVGLIGGSIQFGLASINLRLAASLRRRLRAERTLAMAAHG